MTENTNKIIEKVTRTIIEAAHPQKIILFGSYARGEENADSDIDFLVIKETKEPKAWRSKDIRRKLRGLKFPVDILVYTPEEIGRWKDVPHSFVHSAIREGKVLYG